MNYKVKILETAKKDVKKLIKKYKSLKKDLLQLIEVLEINPNKGIKLGRNFYKIRMKNSDTQRGKSGGYRVIYYLINENKEIWIVKIYSKSEIDNLPSEYIFSLIKEN